jgi:hypothetical protein
MGKRELVLIAVFVALGAAIYQVTAPPLAAGQEGFSLGRAFQNFRRNVQGRRARGAAESARTEPVPADIAELRFNLQGTDLTVLGEDRTDATFAMTVSSNGTDEQDARRLAGLAALKVERAGTGLAIRIDFPRDGQQTATLTVRVPRRLAVRVEAKSGRLDVSDVASLAVKGNRGESVVKNIAGEADLTQRGAALRLTHAGSLRLNAINANSEIADVLGVASVDATGARLQLSGIVGPLDLKSRNSDVRLRDSAALKAPLRLDMQSGELDIEGLRSEARIDGRNTGMRIAIERAAPLTLYNTGDDVVVGLPSGGFTLDAIATDGGLTSEDSAVEVKGEDRERRASGPIRGGGPTLTLRATRGRLELRKKSLQ